MFERRSETVQGIFVNEPFLSARFDGCHSRLGEDDQWRSHVFPKILALGIMLLEIELGIKIEEYRIPEDRTDAEPNVNADHIAAEEVFNKSELWDEKETFPAFKDIVKACLFPDEFMSCLNDVQALRQAFRKRIVDPLETLYKFFAQENPETSDVRPIELKTLDPSVPEPTTESTNRLSSLPAPLPTPAPVPPPYQSADYYSPAMYTETMAQTFSLCHPVQ
jgi:hypothetical protein